MQLTRSSNPVAQAKGWELLELPEFPESLRYLWEYFSEIRMGADESMSGLRITWSALRAWSQFMGVVPEPRECQALFWLDAVVRSPGDK